MEILESAIGLLEILQDASTDDTEYESISAALDILRGHDD